MFFFFVVKSGVRCPHCDEKISPHSRVCRYCTREVDSDPLWQTRLRQRQQMHRAAGLFIAALLIVALAAFIFYAVSEQRQHERASAAIRAPARPPTPRPTATPPQFITLRAPVDLAIPYGKITLQPGTRLQLIERMNDQARIRYVDGHEYSVPVASTDLR